MKRKLAILIAAASIVVGLSAASASAGKRMHQKPASQEWHASTLKGNSWS